MSAIERPERRETSHDVEEVRREEGEGTPARVCVALGVPADEDHEDGDERQGQQHERRRGEVDGHDPGDHGYRNRDREHELRDEPPEVGLERVDSLNRDRRDLAALRAVQRSRLAPEPPLDELEPEL